MGKTVKFKVLAGHPIGVDKPPEWAEVEARATKTPGLVVMKGHKICFDREGVLRVYGKEWCIWHAPTGRRLSPSMNFRTFNETVTLANAMNKVDWLKCPGSAIQNPEMYPYAECFMTTWYGEDLGHQYLAKDIATEI